MIKRGDVFYSVQHNRYGVVTWFSTSNKWYYRWEDDLSKKAMRATFKPTEVGWVSGELYKSQVDRSKEANTCPKYFLN